MDSQARVASILSRKKHLDSTRFKHGSLEVLIAPGFHIQLLQYTPVSALTHALTAATWHSGKTPVTRARVLLPCGYTVHLLCTCERGSRIYSANGVRRRQCAFRRVPFRVEDAFACHPYSRDLPCDGTQPWRQRQSQP